MLHKKSPLTLDLDCKAPNRVMDDMMLFKILTSLGTKILMPLLKYYY